MIRLGIIQLNHCVMLASILLGGSWLEAQTVLYVDDSASNGLDDGSSWANAYLTLQDALGDAASNGIVREIWVAAGVYTPDQGVGYLPGDRDAAFQLINNVAIYGGFAGTETALGQRDVNTNATILSGDLLGDDIPDLGEGVVCISTVGLPFDATCTAFDSDSNGMIDCADLGTCENSFNVVNATGTGHSAVLDGFTVTSGNADGPVGGGNDGGGGLRGGGPTLRNCLFTAHYAARWGGALRFGVTDVVITDCSFSFNAAVEKGGGIIVSGQLVSNPQIARCTFDNNVAADGAGSYCINADADFTDCIFIDNRAHRTAGLWLEKGAPTVTRCRFERNTRRDPQNNCTGGGAIALRIVRTDVPVADCDFIENEGSCSGAVGVVDASPVFRSCRFEGNSANNSGGAIHDDPAENNIMIVDCDFIENSTRASFGDGGAIYFQGAGRNLIQNSRFIRNSSPDNGGAINLWGINGGSVSISNCLFFGNKAEDRGGGAIWIDGGAGSLCTNSAFVGNHADSGGGAVLGYVDLIGCTFAHNETNSSSGGAVALGDTFMHSIANCVFWENRASGQLSHVPASTTGFLSVKYSLLQDDDPDDGSIPFGGAANGNIDDDPVFVRTPDAGTNGWGDADDDYGDLRPSAGSPCIDAGSNGAVAPDEPDLDCDGNEVEPTPVDLSGLPRFVDDLATMDTGSGVAPIVDLGAYEFGPFVGSRIYVDASATGVNDGSSWADAFVDLQDALVAVSGSGCGALEVWVAANTYFPDRGAAQVLGDRSSTFQLTNSVAIYGGFTGTETTRDQRDVVLNPTVLSGDLGAAGNNADNAYHVVSGTGTTALAILDGFTITDGNADQPPSGGGLITVAGGPTLRNCTLVDNTGGCAAGLVSYGGFLTVDNLTLGTNAASVAGIGLSQTQLTLDGDWFLQDGDVDVYESAVDGAGRIDVGTNATLRIKSVAPCDAEIITSLNGNMGATSIFAPQVGGSSPLPPRWEILSAPVTDLVVSGSQTTWFVAPSAEVGVAGMSWSGHFLDQDQSVGGLAAATFLGGGDLTLTGAVYDGPGPGATLLFDGELLTAKVGPFTVQETSATSNQLDFAQAPKVGPTGGFLTSNNLDFILAGSQLIAMVMSQAEQDGGDLGDFSSVSTINLIGDSVISYGPLSLPQGATMVRSDITGTGRIEIEPGARLIVGGNATLNLSGLPSEACNPQDTPGAPAGGTVSVNGSLVVQDAAKMHNTNVEVNLLDFGGANDIVHNDIRLVETSPGYGGEFFASDNAIISCNNIVSEGDRYLDLDPDPNDGAQPIITNNRITVIIKEGVQGNQGALLELRALDFDCNSNGVNPSCASGEYSAPGSPGFTPDPSENWVIERLEILPSAKLNLTNRAGFEFTSNGVAETVYVKNLILYPNATLNTALQTLYYESLAYVDSNGVPVGSNGATIIDIPLLGFSLGVIRMDDPTPAPFNEFDVRVRQRVRDAMDIQPPPPAFPLQGSVDLLADALGSSNGVMQMATRADGDYQSASSVAAIGSFARAGEEDVTVAFSYLFIENANSNAELIVYLSDNSVIGSNGIELGRIRPPKAGRPGAVGSGQFGVFHGTFSRGQLNFVRGTYVELELRGVDARVWIDDWDPRVECLACSDLNGTTTVESGDLLVLLAELGQIADLEGDAWCLDALQNSDQYVDLSDLLAMEVFISDSGLDACGTGDAGGFRATQRGGIGVTLPTAEALLLTGKPSTPGVQEDAIYFVDTNGSCVASSQSPASIPGNLGHRGNGRMTQRQSRQVYQNHALQGIVRLSDATTVVAPGFDLIGGDTVRVGLSPIGAGQFEGVPILDFAFDPDDNNSIYVTPVLVESAGGDVYKATAKLQLPDPPDGTFLVTQLYGTNPHQDSSITISTNDWGDVVFEPDLQRMRELEVDLNGNLFVISAQASGGVNDWITVYDSAMGNASEQRFNISAVVQGPVAMLVTTNGNNLYVSEAVSGQLDGGTRVYRFDIQRNGSAVSSIGFEESIHLVNPIGNDQDCGGVSCGHAGTITQIIEHPRSGDLLVVGFTTPRFPADADPQSAPFLGVTGSILTTPTLAIIPSPATATGTYASIEIGCEELALPVAATHLLEPQPGDADGDGDVDLLDYHSFEGCFQGPGIPLTSGCEAFDSDNDGDIDFQNFAEFARLFTG